MLLPYPTVAIVGRTNVGKSRLFNCLLGEEKALVSPVAGTTRDRNYAVCEWRGKKFILIDTGGIQKTVPVPAKIKSLTGLSREIQKQIAFALQQANVIIFVLDIRAEILPQEKRLAQLLRKIKKPVILACNKADNPDLRAACFTPAALQMGFGAPQPISAANGSGIGDLLDVIVQKIPATAPSVNFEKSPKIAIIGKSNVGKSSLLNAFLQEERAIVSPELFTTREPQDTYFVYKERPLIFIDTAGLRKRAKIRGGLEKIGVRHTLQTIKKATLILFVLDCHQSLTSQDRRIGRLIQEGRKPIIFVANKWDIVKNGDEKKQKELSLMYRFVFPRLRPSPLIFTSAPKGEGISQLLDLILKSTT